MAIVIKAGKQGIDRDEYHALQEVAGIVRDNYIQWYSSAAIEAGENTPLDDAIERLDALAL